MYWQSSERVTVEDPSLKGKTWQDEEGARKQTWDLQKLSWHASISVDGMFERLLHRWPFYLHQVHSPSERQDGEDVLHSYGA